jgi:hypothetical protein
LWLPPCDEDLLRVRFRELSRGGLL